MKDSRRTYCLDYDVIHRPLRQMMCQQATWFTGHFGLQTTCGNISCPSSHPHDRR